MAVEGAVGKSRICAVYLPSLCEGDSQFLTGDLRVLAP